MEFISLEAMCRLVRTAGWSKRDVLKALAEGQLVGIHVRSPGKHGSLKLAIVHPGIQFLDYIRNPEARMRYIPILSERDVAAVLGKNRNYVNRSVTLGNLKPTYITDEKGKKRRRFTAESVRQFLIKSTGKDPTRRSDFEPAVMLEWFNRVMQPKPSSPEQIDEDLRWIDDMCEPERSRYIERLLARAEEARQSKS